jgi:hypothetical protein
MQWCRDTIDYVRCATQFLINCNMSTQKVEADQLQTFIDYITKSSNVHCPGGISGCEESTNDVRCRLGIRYFLGEYNNNSPTSFYSNLNTPFIRIARFSHCVLVYFILKY